MVSKWLDWLRESKFRMIGAAAVVVLAVLGAILLATSLGGEDEIDFSAALAEPVPGVEPGLSESDVQARVEQTIAAQVPTETPIPTPDIPQTLVAMEMAAQATRSLETASSSPGFTDREPEKFGYVLSVSDERYLDNLGLPVWHSVRVHLRLQVVFSQKPEDFLNSDETRRLLEVMERDMNRATRELEGLDAHRSGVTPQVARYGVHIEDLIYLVAESVSLFRSMYYDANEQEGLGFNDLTDAARSEITDLYWDVKDKLDDFDREMQKFGCSVCGELYRGKAALEQ